MVWGIDCRQADIFSAQRFQTLHGTEDALAAFRIERAAGVYLSQLGLQIDATLLEGPQFLTHIHQLAVGTVGKLHIELHKIRHTAYIAFFKSGKLSFKLGDLVTDPI